MRESFSGRIEMAASKKLKRKIGWANFFVVFTAGIILLVLITGMYSRLWALIPALLIFINHRRLLNKNPYKEIDILIEEKEEKNLVCFQSVGTINGQSCDLIHEIEKGVPTELRYSRKKQLLQINCMAKRYYHLDNGECLGEELVESILFFTEERNVEKVNKILRKV